MLRLRQAAVLLLTALLGAGVAGSRPAIEQRPENLERAAGGPGLTFKAILP